RAGVPLCIPGKQADVQAPAAQACAESSLPSSFMCFLCLFVAKLFCASLWLKRLYFETDVRGRRGIRQRLDANQLRTGNGILAHILRRDLSITLDRDGARQFTPDRRQARKLLRVEI